ncbi:MAG: hypothetical protein AB1393_13300 [Candidatus Edwardsbacteria bacterium]
MEDYVKLRDIGSVIADDVSPSFDVFRFKALAKEYVYHGTLVGAVIDNNRFLWFCKMPLFCHLSLKLSFPRNP